jgi:Ca-activated chloride channel family protein
MIAAGTPFDVVWTGPNAPKDYVTIVTIGTTAWTSEPFFYTTTGSPGKLVAPTTPGAYELWYVNGADESIAARRSMAVTDFVGTFSGPDKVGAGTVFSVEWTGPDAPGDYVTLAAVGAERWTDETFFYTTVGSPGSLIAPIVDGDYELWYVAGADSTTMVRQPVTVSPLSITLKAPASVNKGATFQVGWTGPDGPQDYITIVPADSPVGTYASYAYTATGHPVTIVAPDTAGAYEIRYQSDRVAGTFASIPIKVH